MLSKERVGSRIRQVRTQQNKTLREVESASGFSSTHISEIERGRTCPTIGALIQIAHALEKDPSYFLEDRELEEISVVSREERQEPEGAMIALRGDGFFVQSLTSGILGGRLRAVEIALEPGADGSIGDLGDGADICVLALEGSFELEAGDRVLAFDPFSSVHSIFEGGFALRNRTETPARALLVIDPGTVIP
ncbi:MAG: XRE family transcriptional regulator [Candidatus Eisenbacteria bacterium]